jgi:hypothetical protein
MNYTINNVTNEHELDRVLTFAQRVFRLEMTKYQSLQSASHMKISIIPVTYRNSPGVFRIYSMPLLTQDSISRIWRNSIPAKMIIAYGSTKIRRRRKQIII